jgi:hypothetical protein
LFAGDARRLWYALRPPDAPVWLRPVTALLLLYLVSPLDLIPDALPILVLLPLAVSWMLSMLPGSLRDDIARRFGSAAPSTLKAYNKGRRSQPGLARQVRCAARTNPPEVFRRFVQWST